LRDALARHRAIAAAGGWPRVPPGPELRVGAAGERVAVLRGRLAAGGDLAVAWAAGERFDAIVDSAVRRLQQRHGLAPDGVVGATTLDVLNRPVDAVIRQLEMNLERWRWLPRGLEPPYVLVNIPAFQLLLVDHDGVTLRRVVLGRPDWPTPLLAGAITHVILAPTWTVPPEIARQEVIPAVRADSGYLSRLGIDVFADTGPLTRPLDPALVDWAAATADSGPRVRLVQRSGPANPLGRVKFLFDNPLAIYLHDTPATELFAGDRRALSHGCVRVDGAMELAQQLLHDVPGWDASRLAEAAAGVTRSVRPAHPVPIHLVYFTAWVGGDGALQLREDVYGWDAKLAAALAASWP
jgi:murein L,D-transpeptidase YcbB/YkuD